MGISALIRFCHFSYPDNGCDCNSKGRFPNAMSQDI